ncbi:TerD family protein [Streptomyces sp. NPDC088354]|uniref:TerD family protein n=1 Tax=Streptomyces sp. NPDC088354 TaxID=3365856 RepID=UPI00382C7439
MAFCVDETEQVRDDSDFVFFNQTATPEGAASLSVDGPAEQTVHLDLERIPADVARIVIAAAVSAGRTFGEVGAIELTARPAGGHALVAATLDAATSEQTLVRRSTAEEACGASAWSGRATTSDLTPWRTGTVSTSRTRFPVRRGGARAVPYAARPGRVRLRRR